MTRIDGPLDYHRYPRNSRKQRDSAPRPSTTRATDTPRAARDPHPAPHTEHVRNARRSPRPGTANSESEEQQLHLRLDPADLPERHTPPQQRRGQKAYRKRGRSTPAGPPWWKRARRFAGVLLLIGIAEVTAAALTAGDFRVQDVEVSGLDVTSPDDVHPFAQELIGQNWIRANTGATLEAVQALPAVRTASVERTLQWPPQLILRVEERKPFARVGAGDDWWVVDEAGVPFRRAGNDDDRLYAVTSKALEPSLGGALPAASWQPVVEFARALSQDGSTPGHATRQWALRRIYFDKDGFASLRLEGGAHDELLVRLGAGRWPEKLQRAHQALAWFERTGSRASELNLVSYNMPVWTPRTASAEADGEASAELDGANADSQPSSREG